MKLSRFNLTNGILVMSEPCGDTDACEFGVVTIDSLCANDDAQYDSLLDKLI